MTNQIQPVAADELLDVELDLAEEEVVAKEQHLFSKKVKTKFLKAYVRMSPEVLQELIHKAQAGDQEALDRICRQFKPAVEATAKSPSCYSVLGKDAVSCAWIIFIQLILKTKKNVTVYFPGYVKKVLCRKLIKEIVKTSKQLQCTSLDNEECYIEPSVASFEDELTNNTDLLLAIKKLKPTYQKIIFCHYFEHKSLISIAKEQHLSECTIRTRHARALKCLKHTLKTKKYIKTSS